ncbi:MAG: putative 2-dehydropantoate 2-reductase [Spirochaetales bacterium]|nr:putative 2-dehydropantoate 2-reductase [Spirochaetales bacterium]
MKYTILGTGAVGGYYGGKLQQSGIPVDFLARSDYEKIKTDGLRIDSCQGDFILEKVNVYSSVHDIGETDVVVVSMKTTANGNLPGLLEPLVKKGTIILILQNGLGMEEELAQKFPQARILGGMCFICSQKRGPGHIVHMDKGSISAAPLRAEDRPVLEEIRRDFVSAGVEVTLLEDLKTARWNKLLWNIPFNGLSVVLNANTKEMMESEHGSALARTIMEEVLAGAEACGCPLDRESVDKMLEYTRIMEPYEPSMKLDFDNHRKMELDYMYRNPLKEARARGVELPAIRMLTEQLAFMEAQKGSLGR